MRKKPNSKHTTFNLDIDVITLIKEASDMNSMTQSEFLEFLVNSWDDNINPIKKLKHLRTNKKLLAENISDIEKEENLIMDNIEKVQEWRKTKQEKKPEILLSLVGLISKNNNYEAEILAKNQSVKLGIPAMQLIFEAMDIIKKGNL